VQGELLPPHRAAVWSAVRAVRRPSLSAPVRQHTAARTTAIFDRSLPWVPLRLKWFPPAYDVPRLVVRFVGTAVIRPSLCGVREVVNATYLHVEPDPEPAERRRECDSATSGKGSSRRGVWEFDACQRGGRERWTAREAQAWGMVIRFDGRISAGGMTRQTLTDGPNHAALIEAIAQRQDRAAFGELFRYFAPRIKGWMLRAGASSAAAEEMAQEAMLVVWRKADLFDANRAGATTWIFTIARNLRIDIVRRERHPSTLLQDPVAETEFAEPPDHALDCAERDKRVRLALSQLPAEQAIVIRKAFFEDKPHPVIEKELGIPLGTVKSRLRLAVARLRAVLEEPT
jgi:RNA polymerase sigma-70 factor, ECF subfamily